MRRNTATARLAVLLMMMSLSLWGCDKSNSGQQGSSGGAGARPTAGAPAVAPPPAVPDSPDAALAAVAQGLAENKPHVAWDALPASYQMDVSDLVHQFAAKMDAEIWIKSFALIAKASHLLKDKKDMILGMKSVTENPQFDRAKAEQNWDKVVGFFQTIATSDAADLGKLKQLDVRQFIAATGPKLMVQARAMSAMNEQGGGQFDQQFDKLKNATFSVVSRDGDTAVVKMEVPGETTEDEAFTKVEGKWIPKDMADEWKANIENARRGLDELSTEKLAEKKPQIMQALTTVDGIIDQLAATQSPEQFESAMQGAQLQIGFLVMSMMQPPAGTPPAAPDDATPPPANN